MIEQRKWGESSSFGPRQWLRHQLLLDLLVRHVPKGDTRVLDAGCGEGRLAELIAEKGFEVTGFDDSEASIAQARARLPEAKFWVGTMDQIKLEDSSVDAVVSGEVLEHLDDDKAAVREMFRILKPGGTAVVSVPGSQRLWSIDDDWSGHKRRYAPGGLTSLFEAAGFSTVDCRYWGFPVIYTYYRLYYIQMLKKRAEQTGLAGLRPSSFVNSLFALALLPDRLSYLLRLPLGIGLVAVFRKPQASPGVSR